MVNAHHASGLAAADDVRFMRRALAHAWQGWGRTTPNPLVGACIVTDEGVVVGQGAHERAGEPHAEVHALNEAGEAARGATLYCTLEPCAHTGRTGPCAVRIIEAGIRRVVVAMTDPFPLVSGRGLAMLRERGIAVDVGIEAEAARRLNDPFLTAVRHRRPFVILKAAASADGFIAAAPGQRTPITSAAALRHVQFTRAWIDAIAIGSETVRVDDPWLTPREVYRARPLTRVVFDRGLRTRADARLFSTLSVGPVVIATGAGNPDAPEREGLRRAGATILDATLDVGASDAAHLHAVLRALAADGIHSLLVEGGPTLQRAFWDAGLVDYVQLYEAPISLGPGGLPLPVPRASLLAELAEVQVTALGPDRLTEGYVHRSR